MDTKLPMENFLNWKLLRTTSDTTVMHFYFVTLDARTSSSVITVMLRLLASV